MVSGTQTAYTLALQFDMLPEPLREQAASRLVTNIEDYGNHLTTGFLGTPYLCHVLSRFGYDTVAYKLLIAGDLSFLALSGENGRNDDLGTMGWTKTG